MPFGSAVQRLAELLKRYHRGGAERQRITDADAGPIVISDDGAFEGIARRHIENEGGHIMSGSQGPMDQVVFERNRAILNTLFGGPGGHAEFQGETTINQFAEGYRQRILTQESWFVGLIPHGLAVRAVYHRNGALVFIIEVPPGLRTMQWLRDDSPEDYGPDATYRDVHIALPWQYFFIAMNLEGQLRKSSVYFLTAPLRSLTEKLCDPHFFNCSVDAHGVHCWMCSQYFRAGRKKEESLFEYAHSIITQFYFGGFNKSSEHHEGASFWGRNRTRIADKRVRTMEAWETASRKNPDFALTVPWIESSHTAATVLEELTKGGAWAPKTATDLANILTTCLKEKPKGGVS